MANNQDNRRAYRDLLFTTKGMWGGPCDLRQSFWLKNPLCTLHAGLGDYISGAILFEETLMDKGADGRTFADILKSQGIVIGIKVDQVTATARSLCSAQIRVGCGLPTCAFVKIASFMYCTCVFAKIAFFMYCDALRASSDVLHPSPLTQIGSF